ncbi:MAG: hypothetical protein AAGD25_13745 [Cyanobacteria bacterium P01_F01_bin.150]
MSCVSCSTIGYLAETFPQPANSPVIQEILELERQGLPLHIFSLRLPHQKDQLSTALQVKSPVTYIPSMLPHHIQEDEEALIGAHIDLLRDNASGHYAALDFYLSRPEGKELNELLQAGYVALQLQEWDISHVHVPCENVTTATVELIHHISGISYSVTADNNDLHRIDAQVLARRLTSAQFIFTSRYNHQSYLREIAIDLPPVYVLPEASAMTSASISNGSSKAAKFGQYSTQFCR